MIAAQPEPQYAVEDFQPKCVVGIDNGLCGGIAILSQHHGAIVAKRVMPTRERNGKREVDVAALRDWLCGSLGGDFLTSVFVVEEPVGSKSLNAAKSMASSFHAVRGMLETKGATWHAIKPRTWQSAMLANSGDTKADALIYAELRWPDESWLRTPRCTTPHDGMIDAAIIAEHYRTNE